MAVPEVSVMNTFKKEYTFLWFIENYSYCWHKIGEELISPEFFTDGLEGTAWYLGLYPRGEIDKYKGFISLYLDRSKDDAGSENVPVKCELSVLAADGSTLSSQEFDIAFKMDAGYGYGEFLKTEEVLSRRKAEYLPQDTLSVRCKIWKGEGEVQPQAHVYARTRIGIIQVSFLHVTESFSTLEPNHRETQQIKSTSKKGLSLSCSLCFLNDINGSGWIMIEITPSEPKYILSVCKLFLIDRSEKKIECGKIDNRLIRNNIKKFPLCLTKQVIQDRKNEYLSDDKLSVSFECIFSSGIEYGKIEKAVYGKHFVVGNQVCNNDKNDDIYAEQLHTCPSALDDLKAIYNNQFLTDVELETKTKSFHAHKNVLCARSSVFKMMMTNDMKERHTDCIQIDDLEDDTVQQLLLFLYSDVLVNIEWESAIKLYYAGDKYAIDKLKLMCSSFLVRNLSTSNAGELLLLADKHSDSYLKKAVEDFILDNEEAVFSSEEWRSLIKTNSVLVSETMCLKYIRK